MNPPEAFRSWALDPARTLEQLCTLEVFLKWGRVVWGWKHNDQEMPDWNRDAAKRKERRENPAYRPKIDPLAVERTAEVWDRIDKWSSSNHDDRPMRNLDVLRFFPNIVELGVDMAEVRDLSPIAELKGLRSLRFTEPFGETGGFATTNLDALKGMQHLETLNLNLRHPWPDLSALDTLPALHTLGYRGNALALDSVKSLPELRIFAIADHFHYKTPLRSIRQLPRMPKVERLSVANVADLGGIEEMPNLLNVELSGPFEDLSPLAALTRVTYLKLEGERFLDLTPLATLPNLRELRLIRERPLDVAPLSESVSLREVTVPNCPILATELAALNAGLLPWSGDFLAPEPRPLKPLLVLTYRPDSPEIKMVRSQPPPPNPRTAAYGGDHALAVAENRWFEGELNKRLNALLGPEWNPDQHISDDSPGHHHLQIQRYRDVVRLGEIIQVIRELMASVRFPWIFLIGVEPHGDLNDDIEQIRAEQAQDKLLWWERDIDQEEMREDHEDFVRRKRELFERFEREHRMRLLEQQGAAINPEEFSPASKKPAQKTPDTDDEEGEEDDDDDFFDEDDEELMDDDDDEMSQLAEDLSFVVTLEENYLWISTHMRENAEYTLGVKAVDWHALPEPVEKRPRPI